MMELLWTPEAVRDREGIYNYIEEDNPLAALSLDDLISERAAALKLGNPLFFNKRCQIWSQLIHIILDSAPLDKGTF